MKFLIKFIYFFKKNIVIIIITIIITVINITIIIILLLLLLSSSLSLLLHWKVLTVIKAEGFTLELLDDYQLEMQESKALA